MGLPLLDGTPSRVTRVVVPPTPVTPFAAAVAEIDRAVFADLGGESITYQPAAGAPVPVTGMFDNTYVFAPAPGDEAGVETLGPAVFLRLEDLPIDPKLDKPLITVDGVLYRVWRREPDGVGGIVLGLKQAG